MHQVDPAGDGLDPVDRVGQVDARRVRVAGVEAEADLAAAVGHRAAHPFPQPGDRLQPAGHRALAAGGVLDQQRKRPVELADRLDPVGHARGRIGARGDVPAVHDEPLGADRRRRLELLVEQLPARDADPVVGGGHVDHVRGVDVDVHARRGVGLTQRGGIAARDDRSLPPLRVAEEELRGLGPACDRVVQGVVRVEVAADTHHALERSPQW